MCIQLGEGGGCAAVAEEELGCNFQYNCSLIKSLDNGHTVDSSILFPQGFACGVFVMFHPVIMNLWASLATNLELDQNYVGSPQ